MDFSPSIFHFLQDDDRIKRIEDELKEARTKADNADKEYDEVSKKLQVIETDLERAEERGEMGETKIMELEEELKVVANNLKSLEVSEEKANQREIANKEQVKSLTAKLKQAEARAEFAERSVQKLQMEVVILLLVTSILISIPVQVDRLEDELMMEQEKLKGITEELEQTFAEMSGY